jgi:shikimate kinase
MREKPERNNIILIGFMATGKSAIGRLLARKLGRSFVDTDEIIEQREGKPIRLIFKEKGEPYFRELESRVVAEVASRQNSVIACGGGAIVNPQSLKLLKESGWLVCVTATPETVLARAGTPSDRPLLCTPDPPAEIRRLLKDREPYYSQADFTVPTDNLTEREVANQIERVLSKEGYL